MSEDMLPAEAEEYYSKHRIEVALAVSTGDGNFLVMDDNRLPRQAILRDYTSRETAKHLLMRVCGLVDGQYVLLRQVGFLDDPVKTVLYAAEAAERFLCKDPGCRWVHKDDLLEEALRMYQYSSNYKRI